MNSKLAKRLRSIALGMSASADDHKRKEGLKLTAQVAYKTDRDGTITVAANSWKGAYKALKKAAKTGKLPKNGYFPQSNASKAANEIPDTGSRSTHLNTVPNGVIMQASLQN